MDDIIYVLKFAYDLLQTKLSFGSFSFSIYQYLIFIFISLLIADFIYSLFMD